VWIDIVAIAGLASLLTAFALNAFHVINNKSYTYNLLNLIGGGTLTFYSISIKSVPFILLQSIWSIIALVGIVKKLAHAQKETSS